MTASRGCARWLGTVALKGNELPQGPIACAHGGAEYPRKLVPGVVRWTPVKVNRWRLDGRW